MSWPFVPLGELIRPAANVLAGDRDFPLLSMTMKDGLVDPFSKFKKRVASEDTSGYKVVDRGQLVVGFPIDEGVLSFQNLYDQAIVSPAYGIWDVCNEGLLYRPYLEKYLKSPAAIQYYLAKLRSTTARRRSLDRSTFLELSVPLPKLEEQRRIAGILDQADALRRLRTRALDKLNTLGQAIFHEMFGRLRLESIPLSKLGRVCTGSTPSTKIAEYFDGEVPFITPGDLESDRPVVRFLSELGAEKSRTVEVGATLVCCIGATIGKMGMARQRSAFNQQINAIEWGPKITPEYGYFAVQAIRQKIQHLGKGASTTLPILKKSLFEQLPIRVAPEADQTVFADRFRESLSETVACERGLKEVDHLFASLQHRAFRGEL